MTSQHQNASEVIWFISVTKEPDWDILRFEHEYHVVHAGMTAKMAKLNPTLHQYTQVARLDFKHPEEDQPLWNCITCLTWESLDVIWAGFQHPQYKATAGKHVFCRLDQVGTLTQIFDGFEANPPAGGEEVRVLIFHRRLAPTDLASESWLEQRMSDARKEFSNDQLLTSYRLLVDVTPKDTDWFFKDTLFAVGS